MKKILLSLGTIALVAAAAIGITTALFNDVETSTGNIFTAGSIDLKVDHSGAYYNGLFCGVEGWECEPWADHVVSFDQGTRNNGTPVLAGRSDPAQALGEAEDTDTINFVSLGFTTGINGVIVLGFDNIILNEAGPDVEIVETSYGDPSDAQYPETANVYASQDGTTWVQIGFGIIQDEVMDLGSLDWAKFIKIEDISGSGDFNSTADGFDVDGVRAIHCGSDPSVAQLEGTPCSGAWNLKDLDSESFFDIGDIKPGDSGKNVISLEVQGNDSWLCLLISNSDDDENELIDPEEEAGDVSEDEGELSNYLQGFAWNDKDYDGFYEPLQGETAYGPIDSFFDVFTLVDLGHVPSDEHVYVGLVWCAGDLVVDHIWGGITCDGSTVGDDAQTDQWSADLTAYAEQYRNNPNFICDEVVLPTQP